LPRALSNRQPIVAHRQITALLQGAVSRGYSAESILSRAEIPPSIYQDSAGSIDGVELQRLLWAIQIEMNDLFMGFLAQPAKPELNLVQSRIRFQCERLGEAIRASTQTREAVRNDVSYQCTTNPDAGEFTLSVEYQLLDDVDAHLFYWHRLMLMYRYHCWLIGKRIKLNTIAFKADSADKLADHYYAPFNAKVQFAQGTNALVFDSKYLLCPIVRSEAEEQDYVSNYPDWFTIPGQDMSWTRQTEQIIKGFQRDNQWSPTTQQVAKKLSVSARTLRRQLARENETYRDIKAQVRCQQAIKLLIDTDLPIAIVADHIGFAEPGDFTRAFISWTQLTPSAYRDQQRSDNSLFSDIRHLQSF